MEKIKKTSAFLFSQENRLNSFYVLAFLPLLLVAYFYARWPFGLVIPVYGFIIFVIKKQKLSLCKEAGSIQKLFGLLVTASSFLLYYVLVLFFPTAAFYGAANYCVFLLGLFLIFFRFNALKEAFSPLFLIVGAMSSSLVSILIKPFFNPYIPSFTSFIASILKTIGIRASISAKSSTTIILQTLKGPLPLGFVWECVGFASFFVFSVILIVVLAESPGNVKTKALWSVLGILGTFLLNILRIVLIFVTDYFYGHDVGATVHYFIGYILFIAWITIFLYIFQKKALALRISE
jgi:exosortase/archaeosortase family protein